MQEYFFLFGLGLVWVVFAVVQDMRTREIANWLNFSLIAFVLAYRAIYAVYSEDLMFFVYGLVGVILFVILAYGFYYGRIFAGGDAKLLMGIGGILPYQSWIDFAYLTAGFIFLLFAAGSIWGILFTSRIALKSRKRFTKEFSKEFLKKKYKILGILLLGIIIEVFVYNYGLYPAGLFIAIFAIIALVYLYAIVLDRNFMNVLKRPDELTEGDWLAEDVRVKGKWIRKNFQGLSLEEIKVLQKSKKKVLIKEGVPFTPAFLAAFIIGIWILRHSPF